MKTTSLTLEQINKEIVSMYNLVYLPWEIFTLKIFYIVCLKNYNRCHYISTVGATLFNILRGTRSVTA